MIFKKTKVSIAMGSHSGKIRENNEDMAYANGLYFNNVMKPKYQLSKRQGGKFLVYSVCDGMGGESNGEIASMEAVKELETFCKSIRKSSKDLKQVVEGFKKYISETNQIIYEIWANANEGRMGSTFAGLAFYKDQAIAINLGDSRVYYMRDGELNRLSKDHTEATRLYSMGLISFDEIDTHKKRHMLTRHFGVGPEEGIMEADYSEIIKPKKGDLFLLCSDGLTDMLTDNEISQLLQKKISMEKLVFELIQGSLEKGGRDNITAIVVRIINAYR